MLREAVRNRRELGPHEREQFSGVHVGIFNAPHDTQPVKSLAQPFSACSMPAMSAALKATPISVRLPAHMLACLALAWDPCSARRVHTTRAP